MKRNLTEKEKELERTQIKRLENESKKLDKKIELTKKNLEYNNALIKMQGERRVFDDKWRSFLREQKNYEDEKAMEMIRKEIKNDEKELNEKKEIINKLNDEIKNGVEVKTSITD